MQTTPHPDQAPVPSEIAELDFVPSAVTSQTAAFPPTTSADLTSAHRAHLEGQGIDLEVALEMGVRSVGPRTRGALDDQELPYLLPRGEFGLLYPHRSITGGVVPSVRRDDPQSDGEGRTRKYMRPTAEWVAGASPVMMHPRMRQRADTAHIGAYTLLMVEGDKQQLAAVSCAPADVVVVGMPGCAQWHGNPTSSHWEGAAVDTETERLIRGARTVVSAFDADVTTNPAVNREFLRLAQHVRTWCSGDPQLRNVSLPAVNTGSEKAGLDDYLGSVSPAHRTGDLQRLIDTSVVVKKMTKAQIRQRAARKTTVSGPYVDWDKALVRGAGHEDIETGEVKDGPVLLACAIRVKAVHVVQHDMTPGARPQRLADVELRVPHYDGDGQMIRDEEPEVLAGLVDSLLDTPTEILALSGDPAATGVAVHPRLTADIAQAIRATVAGAEWRTAYNRTGWIATPERVAYLTPAGAMTSTGVLEDVRAHFNAAARNRAAAALPDPLVKWCRQNGGLVEIDEGDLWPAAFGRVEDPYDTGTLAQMWPLTLDVGESWSGPLGMHSDACVGTATAGYAWASLSGVDPAGALQLVGTQGHGKTTIAQYATILAGWRVGPTTPVETLHVTAGAADHLDEGLHNNVKLVDDKRKTSVARTAEREAEVTGNLVTYAYSGTRKAKLARDPRTGNWSPQPQPMNRAWLLLTAEKAIDAMDDPSQLGRVLPVRVDRSEYMERRAALWAWLSADEDRSAPLRGLASVLVRQIAAWIEAMPGATPQARLDQWRTELTDRLASIQEDLRERLPEEMQDLPTRRFEVPSRIALGWHLMMDTYRAYIERAFLPDTCRHESARIAAYLEARVEDVAELMARADRQYYRAGSQSPEEMRLDKLRGQLASGVVTILDPHGQRISGSAATEVVGKVDRKVRTHADGSAWRQGEPAEDTELHAAVWLSTAWVRKTLGLGAGDRVTEALGGRGVFVVPGDRSVRLAGAGTKCYAVRAEVLGVDDHD